MNRITKGIVLTLSVLVFGYVGLGYVLGKTNDDKAYRALSVFTEVLQHIQQDYVDDPNMPLVTNGAMRGLLESLDPLSSYLSPNEYAEYKKKTENPPKGDIGVALSKRFGYVIAVAVLPDSPAFKAGLRSGDILESISHFATRDMSVGQAEMLMKGEVGSDVVVAVVRRGKAEPQEVHVTRGELEQPKIYSALLGEPDVPAGSMVGYLRVSALTAGKSEEIRQKIQQLEKQGARKLILDLRDCALGPASEGFALARLFVSSGKLATLKGQTVPTQEFSADATKTVWRNPISVLISNSTSGAAELAAAAIADNGRGPTIGERTFGTASEQRIFPLEDGAALILTIANYFTPNGKNIPDDGVVPSVEVKQTPEEIADAGDESELGVAPGPEESPKAEGDAILKKAIELLLSPNPPAKKDPQKVSFLVPSRQQARAYPLPS